MQLFLGVDIACALLAHICAEIYHAVGNRREYHVDEPQHGVAHRAQKALYARFIAAEKDNKRYDAGDRKYDKNIVIHRVVSLFCTENVEIEELGAFGGLLGRVIKRIVGCRRFRMHYDVEQRFSERCKPHGDRPAAESHDHHARAEKECETHIVSPCAR